MAWIWVACRWSQLTKRPATELCDIAYTIDRFLLRYHHEWISNIQVRSTYDILTYTEMNPYFDSYAHLHLPCAYSIYTYTWSRRADGMIRPGNINSRNFSFPLICLAQCSFYFVLFPTVLLTGRGWPAWFKGKWSTFFCLFNQQAWGSLYLYGFITFCKNVNTVQYPSSRIAKDQDSQSENTVQSQRNNFQQMSPRCWMGGNHWEPYQSPLLDNL